MKPITIDRVLGVTLAVLVTASIVLDLEKRHTLNQLQKLEPTLQQILKSESQECDWRVKDMREQTEKSMAAECAIKNRFKGVECEELSPYGSLRDKCFKEKKK